MILNTVVFLSKLTSIIISFLARVVSLTYGNFSSQRFTLNTNLSAKSQIFALSNFSQTVTAGNPVFQ